MFRFQIDRNANMPTPLSEGVWVLADLEPGVAEGTEDKLHSVDESWWSLESLVVSVEHFSLSILILLQFYRFIGHPLEPSQCFLKKKCG